MEQLNRLLAEKESALAKAQATVLELQNQVDTLRKTLAMLKPTKFEEFLKSEFDQTQLTTAKQKPNEQPNAQAPASNAIMEQHPQKNSKGALSPVILRVMADGKTRTVEETLADVNCHMAIPTTRGSVRATLGKLKEKNELVSVGYGKYQLPKEKGEGLSVTSTEAFKLQPSPNTGTN